MRAWKLSAFLPEHCGRGEFRHVRVSNAIRLRVEDLEDFIRRDGR
jgi:hypothetical protein